jgi:hypothetical protein
VTLESGGRADSEFRLSMAKWLLHCHVGRHPADEGEEPAGLIQVIGAV